MRLMGIVVGISVVACNSGGNNLTGDAGPDGSSTDGGDATVPTDGAPDAPDGPSTGIGGPPIGTCEGGGGADWCWVLPLPQGDAIEALWASSASDVWFSTQSADAYHYNGTTWTRFADVGDIHTFAGVAANSVFATTTNGVLRWNGTAWIPEPNAGGISAFAAFGANDVWSVNRDTANHWDGTSWTQQPGPGFAPLAVGGDATNLLAISETGTIKKLLGTVWGTADVTSHPGYSAVVIDPTHIVVAQDQSVSFWDSGTWTTTTLPVAGAWTKVAARAVNDVWVTGPQGRYHWNGTAWTSGADPTGGFVTSMWQAPNGDFFISDFDAGIRRWNAGTWTSLTANPGRANAVWGFSNTDIWAIGSGYTREPFAVHWNGTSWTSTPLLGADIVHHVNAIWGAAPNDVWIAGGDYQGSDVEQRQMLHWDGTSWTHYKLGTEDGVTGQGFRVIRGFAANDIFAASPFKVYHWDGTSWSPFTVPLTRIEDVFGGAANDLYVAGGNTLAHWDGSAWTTKTTPVVIYAGEAISPTSIWLQGPTVANTSVTELIHYDGTFFVTASTGGCPNHPEIIRRGSDLITCENGSISKRPITFPGTATIVAVGRPLQNSWFAPGGHLYVPGLQVHAP